MAAHGNLGVLEPLAGGGDDLQLCPGRGGDLFQSGLPARHGGPGLGRREKGETPGATLDETLANQLAGRKIILANRERVGEKVWRLVLEYQNRLAGIGEEVVQGPSFPLRT